MSNSKAAARAIEYRARALAATEAARACVLEQPRQQNELAAARWIEMAEGEEGRAAKCEALSTGAPQD